MREDTPSSEQLMETEAFAYHVLQSEGFDNWTVKFSTAGSICLRKAEEIILYESHRTIFDWRSKLIVIHEIAHIRTPEDMKHSELFMKEYANLILKYLGGD